MEIKKIEKVRRKKCEIVKVKQPLTKAVGSKSKRTNTRDKEKISILSKEKKQKKVSR